MAVCFRNIEKVDGYYGPTASGKRYKPNPVHNPTAEIRKDKSRWSLIEPHQYCVFEEADTQGWLGSNGLIGLVIADSKLQIVGLNNEVLAFFPATQNEDDPWHGYPVVASRLDDSFDKYFKSLFDSKSISKQVYSKLIRKKI